MKRILIIEDNDDNLYLVKFMLEKHDIGVIVAETGMDGFRVARTEMPDLILMDIQLPDINGMDVTRMIRREADMQHIPVIAITSYAMTGDRQRALDAGCNGYIEKPINPETFMQTILKYL